MTNAMVAFGIAVGGASLIFCALMTAAEPQANSAIVWRQLVRPR
jgi:hypothetical protein